MSQGRFREDAAVQSDYIGVSQNVEEDRGDLPGLEIDSGCHPYYQHRLTAS